jgi:AcrR family transcriptional regulator
VDVTPGLRERKKAETRQALRSAAFRLAAERGPDDVTVAEIASAANVSVRTFFNYFPSKESAMVGADLDLLRAAGQAIRSRPPGETPLEALRNVLLPVEDGDLDRFADWTLTRHQLVIDHPSLRPAQMSGLVDAYGELTEAIADRIGVAPTDLYPAMLVATALSTLHLVLVRWENDDRARPLREEFDRAFALLDNGFSSASHQPTAR